MLLKDLLDRLEAEAKDYDIGTVHSKLEALGYTSIEAETEIADEHAAAVIATVAQPAPAPATTPTTKQKAPAKGGSLATSKSGSAAKIQKSAAGSADQDSRRYAATYTKRLTNNIARFHEELGDRMLAVGQEEAQVEAEEDEGVSFFEGGLLSL